MTTDKNKQIKQCTRCLETLPMEEFYYVPSTGRYTPKCKPCTSQYNMERAKLAPQRPKKKVSLYELHTKLLSGLGPGIELFSGRYVHTYREFSLYLGPWGYIIDGELLYGDYEVHDVVHTLHARHMKLMQRRTSDVSLEQILSHISLVRNSCGVPIEVRFAKSLVSLDQYFLWMDKPRKLLISEAAHQLSLSQEILKFLVPEKNEQLQSRAASGNLKNSSDISPQVYEFAEE